MIKWLGCRIMPTKNDVIFALHVFPPQKLVYATIVANDASLCSTILVLFVEFHPGRPGGNIPHEQKTTSVSRCLNEEAITNFEIPFNHIFSIELQA